MTSEAPKEKLGWLYGGPSAIVDRDAYLSGRKIDKNFELFGDAIKKDDASKIEALARRPKASEKVSALLDLDTIRKEDPLVAVKVQEEKARREIFENPVKMKQLQKIILDTMEKKLIKGLKKDKSKKKKMHSSSEEGSEQSPDRFSADDRTRRRRDGRSDRSPDNRGKRLSSSSHRVSSGLRERLDKDGREGLQRRHGEHESGPSCSDQKQHSYQRKRHRSSSSSSSSPRRKDSKHSEPTRRNRHDSDSDDDQQRRRVRHYGLVVPTGKTQVEQRKDYRSELSYELPRNRKNVAAAASSSLSGPTKAKRKLTEKEKQKLLDEMQENAKWRDEQRMLNVKKLEMEEMQEEQEASRRPSTRDDSFSKSLLLTAASSGSVADRVKSNIHKIQRAHDSMHQNFVRK